MTPTEAAEIIGCSPQQVRYLIRTGKLRATQQRMPGGYWYEVHAGDVWRYAAKPQTVGRPRKGK